MKYHEIKQIVSISGLKLGHYTIYLRMNVHIQRYQTGFSNEILVVRMCVCVSECVKRLEKRRKFW